MDVVWRLRTSLRPDLIIFRRARRVGRAVRYLFLSILKQLGLRPFSNKLGEYADADCVTRYAIEAEIASNGPSCVSAAAKLLSKDEARRIAANIAKLLGLLGRHNE